ncbi:response regulator [Haloplanus sp. GCM10025708]|uniref:response regulator n=1 Tax=Haloplanus sp. GCM10025708 TaxID=3252679 RepID=UPI00361BC570
MPPSTGDTPSDADADVCHSPRGSDGQRLVLVVDDDEALAESVRIWIEQREEWRATTATAGDEALDVYGPHVDVVFLDRQLSRTTGAEVLESMRERNGDARVAMMTAIEPDWDILELSFDMYLTKPVGKEDVHEATQELIHRNDYARELQALFALSSKIATLQPRYPRHHLEDDERYQRLLEEFDRVESAAQSAVDDIDGDEFTEYLRMIEQTNLGVDNV